MILVGREWLNVPITYVVKNSGITNDPDDWDEDRGNTVSIMTMDIVANLPQKISLNRLYLSCMDSFRDIHFGCADAKNEMLRDPNLLLEGYLDVDGSIGKLLSSNYFLVLGSKGSGKSALGSRIKLMSRGRKDLFVEQYDLHDFPYHKFDQLIPSRESPSTQYPINWEFILRTCILSSIKEDKDIQVTSPLSVSDLKKVIAQFEEWGLLEGGITNIVHTATRKGFEINLFKFFKLWWKTQTTPNKKETMEKLQLGLKKLCRYIRTPNQHIIILDGLDEVLLTREKQFISLSSLFLGADRVNKDFQELETRIKIVLLCRRDLLNKIRDPNLNKIITDSGFYLDWYQDVQDVTATNLVKLINQRARVSLGRDVDVFNEFFPKAFDLKRLLYNTRHTPRDVIQLMNNIQLYMKETNNSVDDIKKGIRKYSLDYFKYEINDELVGFLSDKEVRLTFQLLSSFGKANFTLNEIQELQNSDDKFRDLNLRKIFSALYACSAIGTQSQDTAYLSWKYRNWDSEFSPNQIISVHSGLFKALNIHYNPIPFHGEDHRNHD